MLHSTLQLFMQVPVAEQRVMSGDSLEYPSDSHLNSEDYHLIQAVYNKPNVHRRLMRHAKSPKGYSSNLV